jgi:hypothetical protein
MATEYKQDLKEARAKVERTRRYYERVGTGRALHAWELAMQQYDALHRAADDHR